MGKILHKVPFVVIGLMFFCFCERVFAQYAIIDLGTLSGTESTAKAINNSGQIVGKSSTSHGETHAFLWQNGAMRDLGTLGGTYSCAYEINDAGQVVGESTTSTGYMRAFIWQNGLMTDIGTLGGYWSLIVGINKAGQVAGSSSTSLEVHPFIWENGTMTDLGTLGGGLSYAMDINDSGQVVGHSYDARNDTHAFIWQNGLMTDLGAISAAYAVNNYGDVVGTIDTFSAPYGQHAFIWRDGIMTDLGTLGESTSWAWDINDSGQVIGYSDVTSFSYHAFIWDSINGMRDLGSFGGHSTAYRINNNGQVVGVSEICPGCYGHAFIWDGINEMQDLRTLAFDKYSSALAINESGQVVGYSSNDYGERHAVLWTTLESDTDPPVLLVPSGITLNATDPYGTIVNYSVSAWDNLDRNPLFNCIPASGSIFPIGTSAVNCTASDNSGNVSRASFQVFVKGASEQLSDLITYVSGFSAPNGLVAKLLDASFQVQRGHINGACSDLKDFISQVNAQTGKTFTPNQASELIASANRLRVVLNCK